jgi:hypothetical protein
VVQVVAAIRGGSQRVVRGFDLYEKLKEFKPAQLVAYDQDDEQIKVNVPEVRQRHARVMAALQDVPWVRVDLLDKKGGLLHRHLRCADDRNGDSAAGELEDMGGRVGGSRGTAELAGLVSIMLRAQEAVLIRHQQATQQVLDSQMKLMDAAMRRLELQETQLAQSMNLNHALSGDLVNAQLALVQPREDEPAKSSLSDQAMQTLLPMFLRAARSGPVKLNGAADMEHPEPAPHVRPG